MWEVSLGEALFFGLYDWEEKLNKREKRLKPGKLKPAKQRANQKQAKIWATKVARKGVK